MKMMLVFELRIQNFDKDLTDCRHILKIVMTWKTGGFLVLCFKSKVIVIRFDISLTFNFDNCKIIL